MPLRKFFSILVVFILLFQNSPLAVLAVETEEEQAEEVVSQGREKSEDTGEETVPTEGEPEPKEEKIEPQAESELEIDESQTGEENDVIKEEVEDSVTKEDESEETTLKTEEGFIEESVVEKKEAEIFNNAYNPQKGGILELTKSEVLDKIEEMRWVEEEGVYTTSREVRVGETYEIPELGGLKIEFTDISGEPGKLYVKEVSAPESVDGAEVVGKAYDITSDMENGTFEYDLYLPKQANQDVEVKYSEDGDTYEDVENEKQEFAYVKAEGLDHFTVFVVVAPLPGGYAEGSPGCPVAVGVVCYDTIQEAIDEAALTPEVDEIIVSDGTYNENITVDTQVILRAENQHQAVIDGAILIDGPDLVEIDGFRIENGSTMFGGTVGGIITTGSHHRIVNNKLVGDGSPCLYPAIHHTALPGDSLYVENNEIYDWCQGVYLNPSSGHVIQNNNFHDNLVGIGSDGLSNVQILNNNFENNTLEGFGSSNVGVSVVVRGNTFEGNGSGIGQYSGNQIDARENWWGDSTGPFDNDNTDGSNPLENPGGLGDSVVGNVDYRDFVTLGTIQGRKYLDTNLNTWMDSDEYPGVQNWQINLYDSNWTQLSTMVTGDDSAVSGNVDNDQFRFEGLNAGTYYVCEEMQTYHLQNGPALGDNPRTRDGSVAHTDAIAVQNMSPNSSTEGHVCWEVEVDGSQVGYIKFGNIELEDPSVPEQTGYRDSDDEVYTCTGDFSSKLSISVEWTDETTGTTPPDNLLKYLREYSQTGTDGDWHGHEVYSDNHTNLRSFGFGEVIHYSRVKAFYDLNNNDRFDVGEPNSDWSNVCSITHDVTDPEVDITSHEDGDWVRREVTIEGEVHDDNLWRYWFVIQKFDPSTGDYTTVDGLNTQYDDGPDVDITFNWNSDAGGLDDGIYIVKLEARDKAMNKEPDQAPVVSDPEVEGDSVDWVTLNVDNTAPTPPNNPSWLEGDENGDEIGCGAYTSSYEVTATWEDSMGVDSDVEYYKYRSYNPDSGWIWNDPNEIYETYRTGYFTEGEGQYGFAVKSVDHAGNESEWNSMTIDDSCKVTYDITAPDVSVWQKPANNVYTHQSQNIILDWSDSTDTSGSEVGYEYESYHVERGATWRSIDHCGLLEDSQLPNDQVGPGGSCVNAPASTFSRDGEYQRKVRAVDEAGNTSAWSSTYSLFRDTVDPVSYVEDSITADVVNDLTFDVYYDATDDRSGVKQVELFYRKDGGPWSLYGTYNSSPISVTVSDDGVYDFYTVAEDKADDLTVDDMNDGSNGDNGVGNVEDKDPVVESTVRVDRVSLSIVDIEFDKTPPIYKDGDVMELTIEFENNSPMPISEAGDVLYAAVGLDRYTWENHMYRGEMDLPDVEPGNTGRVTFMIPIPAPGSDSSNPEYWTDDDAYTVSSVLRMRNGYKDYDHNNGNYTFEIDNTPPVVDLTSHEDGDVLSGTETLLGDIEEKNPSHYNISLNPAPDGTCNNKQDTWDFSERLWQDTVYNDNTVEHNLDTTEFDDGYYMIRLAARDFAGNRDPMVNTGDGVSVEVVCVTIDNTAPTVDQLSDETYYEGEEVPTIEVTASDNHELATLEYSVEYGGETDSVDISSGTYDVTQDLRSYMTYFDTSVIEEGVYTVEYWVTDTAGHESTHYTVDYTIENVSPFIENLVAAPNTIEEGDTVDFSGTFTDPSHLTDGNLGGSPDDSDWTVEIDYGEGDGYQLVGTMTEPGSVSDVHQYDEDGTYTVTMRVCEASQSDNPQSEETCDTATTTVTVNNPPAPATAEENQPLIQLVGEQVLGAELIGRDVLAEEEEEENEEGEVLGERTCDERTEVSGYVYIDKDEDGKKDDNEDGIEGVTVEVYYYDEDGERVDVTEVETDEDGYWKADLCPGTYKVKADKEDLPEKTEISNEELEIEVTDEDMESVDFSVKQLKGFNWLWLLIPLFLLLILVVLVALNRKKEEK